MKLTILAVGHKLPDWVAAGCSEYIKRMPRELPLTVLEIKPEPRGTKTREQLLSAEKTRLQAALQGFSRIVVLDERGEDLTTLKLAQRLESWMREGGDTAFIIGGADVLVVDPAAQAAQVEQFLGTAPAAPSTTTTLGAGVEPTPAVGIPTPC